MWHSFLQSAGDPTRHISYFKITADQPEHVPVLSVTLYLVHKNFVIHLIKELPQIELHASTMACCHMGVSRFNGLMALRLRRNPRIPTDT